MVDPVTNAVNQTYEREEIAKWLQDHDTDPRTNVKLSSKTLNESLIARQTIDAFLTANPKLRNSDAIYLSQELIVQCYCAIANSDIIQVRELVRKDSRILYSYIDQDRTLFHHACENGSAEVLEFILSKYTANELVLVQALTKPGGWQPKILNQLLFKVIEQGEIKDIQRMFDLGAELEGCDAKQKTALLIAAEAGKQSVVEMLLAKGANISARDINKNAALDLALIHGHDGVVASLLDYGIPDYEPRDAEDRTLLTYQSMFYLHKQILALSGKTVKPSALISKKPTIPPQGHKLPQAPQQYFKPEKSEAESQSAPEWTATVPPGKPG